MKAVFLTGLREMEIRQVPEPKLAAPTDVLLEIDAVGVCGSDMHYYKAGRIGCQLVEYPWIVGHECAGVAVEVGSAVSRVKVGDRVAVDPLITCGQCDQCRIGHIHTCRNQAFLGCPQQVQGSLCEYLLMPEASCFPIPDAMSMTQATLSEPYSIAMWARKLAEPPDGARIGILGSGPIGLSVLVACKHAAPCTVYQTDLLANRSALARQLGADWTGNPHEGDVVAEIRRAEPDGLDVVFECVGEQETVDQCLELVKPCCKVVIVGIPEGDRLSFEMNHMRRKEVRVQNVRRHLHQVAPAIESLASGEVDLDALVTHHFALGEVHRAYELLADYRDNVVKAMIHVKGDS
ncbi:MAG: alcohol dehydrogenase catalytic domain-containing protein [Phycisphaerae bacterium]